jgi:LPXTG-site transpeptidase (sortase) family protein
MPKKLLLPSAKSGVLIDIPQKNRSPWWHKAAFVLGLIVVLVGSADAVSRVAERFFGEGAAFTAFAPAALLLDHALQGEVQGTTTAAFIPARLVVPAIGVDARVEQVGKTAEGAMDTPEKLVNVAWYKLGAKPGGEGNAVFAGHVNNALGFPGVFKELSQLKKGDTIKVSDSQGSVLTYQVESITSYTEGSAPLEEIFTNAGPSRVVLITCGGTWDEATRTFDKRLVVVAHLQ